MLKLTANILSSATSARIDRSQQFLPHIILAMSAYSIDATSQRAAMFLANVGHESGGLHWVVEIWGPTATQSRYEGREDLGNSKHGDGFRFRGRGLFQTTGRSNYRSVRDRLRSKFSDMDVPDFEEYPDELAEAHWAALSAADFADREGLNAVADVGDFDGYCDKINRGHKTRQVGDSNGYDERLALYNKAIKALG